MSTADEISAAYAVWTEAYKQLITAEQELAILKPSVNVALRTAAQTRVAGLRAKSDELLWDANSKMHELEAIKATKKPPT